MKKGRGLATDCGQCFEFLFSAFFDTVGMMTGRATSV